LWRSNGLGEVLSGQLEVDLWLQSDGATLYVLGAREATKESVEEGGIFAWSEVVEDEVGEEGGTVVRALTGEREMTGRKARAAQGTGPQETPEAMEELRRMMAEHEQ
jgi:hypothetical protein